MPCSFFACRGCQRHTGRAEPLLFFVRFSGPLPAGSAPDRVPCASSSAWLPRSLGACQSEKSVLCSTI
nr:MAG TPA_asm: hypothetical protein [Caudoviricetes sp.]